MNRIRVPLACAGIVMTSSALALTISPAAHADPLAGVRQAVVNARAGSTCSALNYSIPLEGEAQHYSGNMLAGVPPIGQYHGTFVRFSNNNDPADRAINGLATLGSFTAAVSDCSYKDFGVGFYRESGFDTVSAALGKPNAAPAPGNCASGYVWREANPTDHVCVSPEVRTRTAQDNAAAASRVDPRGASGPKSCTQGFVWRNAFQGDAVCVTPTIRDEAAADNAASASRVTH